MPIFFYCPRGHRLKAPRRKIGQIIDCPICQAAVIIPAESSAWTASSGTAPPPLPDNASQNSDAAEAAERSPSAEQSALVVDRVLEELAQQVAPSLECAIPTPPPPSSGGPAEPLQAGPPPVQPTPPPEPVPLEIYEAELVEATSPFGRKSARSLAEPGTRTLERIPPKPSVPRIRRVWRLTPDVDRPEPGQLRAAAWVLAYLAVATLFSAFPALPHIKLETAPPWTRVVLLVALVQAAYVAWFWATPDWAAARVLTVVFVVVSALYAAGAAVAYATPLDAPLPLELSAHRFRAGHWCAAVLLLMVLGTYLAGRLSVRWQRRAGRAAGQMPGRAVAGRLRELRRDNRARGV